ncbi:MAG: ABC transporter substrate-binding protein [Burkholderiales bacterium]|nr:ABC transporter substrate-binding protein [Burkholderiales bacterium]
MTDRRAALAMLAGVAAGPARVGAQSAGRAYRIGWLSSGAPRTEAYNAAFLERLREQGFVEGRNFVVEFRSAEWRAERLPALAAELERAGCDVLFAPGPEATLRALKEASRERAIVFAANDYDPVARGHVPSLAKPGGRITGVTQFSTQLAGKRLEVLRELVPAARRVAVFTDPASENQLQAAQEAAKALGLALQVHHFKTTPYDYEAGFADFARHKAESLLMLSSGLFVVARARIPQLAIQHRLPGVYNNYLWAESGGLVSYGANFNDTYRRAADKVALVLKGVRPADIPVEQPTAVEMVVNLRSAKALGVAIPETIRARADRVIE